MKSTLVRYLSLKSIFKYILVFISELISRNLVKIAFAIVALITFHYAGTFADSKNQIKIIKIYVNPQDSLENLYLSSDMVDNKIKYNIHQLSDFNNPTIEHNSIVYYKYNDVNIILWAIFVICLILIVIGTLMDDDNTNWGIYNILRNSIESTIYCEIEDGKYVYMSFGRLIYKSDTQVKSNDSYLFKLNSLTDLWKCPKYQTINNKRDSLLDKILK